MQEKQFIPISFGVQKDRAARATEAYSKLCESATEFYTEILLFFGAEATDQEDLERFLKFHKDKSPDHEFIAKLFEFRNPDGVLEFDYLKMAKLGALKFSPDILSSRRDYHEDLKEVSGIGFRFDLMDCFHGGVFELPDNFKVLVTEHYTLKTKSQEENEAIEKAQLITDGLNWMIQKGILSSSLGTLGLFQKAAGLFSFNKFEKNAPVTVAPRLMMVVRENTILKAMENEEPIDEDE